MHVDLNTKTAQGSSFQISHQYTAIVAGGIKYLPGEEERLCTLDFLRMLVRKG